MKNVSLFLITMEKRICYCNFSDAHYTHFVTLSDYYSNCEIQYKSLPNIHSVRKSFQQLRAVLNSDDQAK